MCHANCGGCGGGKGCCSVSFVARILLIIGGINWGLIGLGILLNSSANWNVVNMIIGSVPVLEAIVYLLVGVAAVMKIFGCRCKKCMNHVPVEGGMEHKM